MTRGRNSGVTLIELVIAITLISMTAATIVGLLSFMSRGSAEGMVATQSAQIASAYLKRILAEEFRGTTDDITPYNGDVYLGVEDALGNPVVGLENYRVAVTVSRPTLSAGTDSVSGNDTRLVTVAVTDPIGGVTRLSGVRTRRPP
jgi:type II secretory pathway pseudopilin PulG